MNGPVTNSDDFGPRMLLAFAGLALAGLLALALTGPEPALDSTPVTPATAAPAVPFAGQH